MVTKIETENVRGFTIEDGFVDRIIEDSRRISAFGHGITVEDLGRYGGARITIKSKSDGDSHTSGDISVIGDKGETTIGEEETSILVPSNGKALLYSPGDRNLGVLTVKHKESGNF